MITERSCSCYEQSRFDPVGNLTLLVTCSGCLEDAYKNIREAVCNSVEGVIQLELLEGYGAEGSDFGYKPSAAEGGRSE